MKILLIISLIIFSQLLIFSQKGLHTYDLDKKAMNEFNEAVKLSRNGHTDKAIKEFEKLYKKFPTLHETQLRIATIYYERKDFEKALNTFNTIIAKDNDYDAEVYYSAGIIAFDMKNYAQAEKYFGEYILRNESDNLKNSKALKLRNDCIFRDKALKNPKQYNPIALSNFINSTDSEFLPSTSLDGKTILFTRRIDNINEDIFVSAKNENGDWSVAVPMEEINTRYNESSASLSDDGSIMIFTKCDDKTTGFGSCDLFLVKKENDKWGIPQNLGEKINTPGWESQPCVIDNGKTIIFSSDRKGSVGSRDLWMISRAKNGKWGVAKNLGEFINTSSNEESPFLHPDGKSLFFRSDGHAGMGSFDIFVSRWDEEKRDWGKPVNLGYPINTEGSEGALYVSSDGVTAYFATDIFTKPTDKRNLDICQFELPVELRPEPVSYVRLKVLDATTKEILKPSYSLVNLSNSDTIIISEVINETTLFALRQNNNYSLHVEKQGYVFHSENFNTNTTSTFNKEINLKIELQKIKSKEETKPIVLNNIFFKTGSSELLNESNKEIEKLVELLSQNSLMNIKIIGHTDNIGNDADNLSLSQNRAKSVVDALVKKGISSSRLSSDGKGEGQPIADNNTENGRSKNRRTEFVAMVK